MSKWPIRIVLAAGIFLPAARSANLTLVPIDAFGRTLAGCRLEEFQSVAPRSGKPRGYQDRFHSFAGRELPLGKYDVAIACGDSRLTKQILLNSADQIELVVRGERIMVSDPTKPELSIEMDAPRASGETWWVIFSGLYNGLRSISPFDATAGRFAVIDPEPGSYFVTIESAKGYSCSQHIDLIEFTRSWKFDPDSCSFRLDDYAHLVTDRTKGNDPWYAQMQLRIDDFFRALRKAAQKR